MRFVSLVGMVAASLLGPLSGSLSAQYSSANPHEIGIDLIATGLSDTIGTTEQIFPTDLAAFPDGSDRLLVATLGGTLRVIDGQQQLLPTAFVDTSSPDSLAAENGNASYGMTTLAFHPDFANSSAAGFGKLYTIEPERTQFDPSPDFAGIRSDLDIDGLGNPTGPNPAHDRVLYEYSVSDLAANTFSGTKREVFRIHEYRRGHDVNDMAFDADGLLYVASGDTTVASAAQDLGNVFGKILRLDPLHPESTPGSPNPVSDNGNYRVPADNPFVADDTAVDEIFAYGLRNPFRISVDEATNQLWVSSNGGSQRESVYQTSQGDNHGWPFFEGSLPRQTPPAGFTLVEPTFEYDHGLGQSVNGVVVYRGRELPTLEGMTIFADFLGSGGSGARLFYGDPATGEFFDLVPESEGGVLPSTIVSVGVDDAGELYVLGTDGTVSRLKPGGLPGDYNDDGFVDAADFTVWRNHLGSSIVLPNDTSPGEVTLADYDVWVANFGSYAGSASAPSEVVPEPAAGLLVAAIAVAAGCAVRRVRSLADDLIHPRASSRGSCRLDARLLADDLIHPRASSRGSCRLGARLLADDLIHPRATLADDLIHPRASSRGSCRLGARLLADDLIHPRASSRGSFRLGGRRIGIVLGLILSAIGTSRAGGTAMAARATGVVFRDANGDAVRGQNEQGIPGVRVSNGRQVVTTDQHGRYELPVDDDTILFVIKPRDLIVPLDKHNLPQFYYIHKPEGSPPNLKYPGVSPTGPLPDSVDFPLVEHPEGDRFEVLIFGDPQPNNIGDIDHMAHDIVADLIDNKAAFGLTLGDLMADRLDLFEPYNQVMAQLGRPLYNTLGNHDINFDVPGDDLSDETWERVFGPATYSFDWGPVHFVVLDDVYYGGGGEETGGGYHGAFTPRVLEFVENDLKHVPREKLVVIAMHIPLTQTNHAELLQLLKGRPHTLSLSGHTHDIQQHFLGRDHGWPNQGAHHHVVGGALCGIHWLGAPDEYGIPHAMTHCGSPNGYLVARFEGDRYQLTFRAPRRPASDQMHIFAPSSIPAAEVSRCEVIANIYLGNEKNVTDMRVDQGDWIRMSRTVRQDPYLERVIAKGHPLSQVKHIWTALLPSELEPGGHTIQVRTTDMYGQTFSARRVIRIE